ncbi:hypothetical protein BOX15_Mlig015112g2, partial [Macrostomum lignano]
APVQPLVRNRKQLESLLQQVPTFANPQSRWEQYATPGEVAASWLYDAKMRWNCFTAEQSVLDLGCGPGALMTGCLALGSGYVCGVDIDSDSLDLCRSNLMELFSPGNDDDDNDVSANWDLLQADVTRLSAGLVHQRQFDVVVTNPPFGTYSDAKLSHKSNSNRRNRKAGQSTSSKGIDIAFLEAGIAASCGLVFSLHKTATMPFVMHRARQACARKLMSSDDVASAMVEGRDYSVSQVANLRYNLNRSYNHHLKESKDIEVSILEVAFLR